MITDKMCKHIENDWKGLDADGKKQSRWTLFNIMIPNSFKKLIFLAKNLREEDRKKIFTSENLRPVVNALLGYDEKKKSFAKKEELNEYYELAKLFYSVSSRRLEEMVTNTLHKDYPTAWPIVNKNIIDTRHMLVNWQIKE